MNINQFSATTTSMIASLGGATQFGGAGLYGAAGQIGQLGSLGQSGMIGGNMGSANAGLGQTGQNQGAGNSELVDSMVDRIMGDMFDGNKFKSESGDGSKSKGNQLSDDNLAQKVAEFMDKNPEKYGTPHDSTGRVRNWNQELAEDNIMSDDEKATFKQALTDYLKSKLGGGNGIGGAGQDGNLLNKVGNDAMNNSIDGDKNGGGQMMDILKQLLQIVAQMMDGNSGAFGSPSQSPQGLGQRV
ncbi:MAG: hypothetical protein P8Y42_03565 [Exilibacterium sp.]